MYEFSDAERLKQEEKEKQDHAKVNTCKVYHPADSIELPLFSDLIKNREIKANVLQYLSSIWQRHNEFISEGTTIILGGTDNNRGRAV